MEPDKEHGASIDTILQQMFSRRGFDVRGYKMPSLQRRISRRMDILGISALAEYAEHLEAKPDEYKALFNTILINVTQFFRDPEAWIVAKASILPPILENTDEIRIWSAGCSSGEEPYSVAITLAEILGPKLSSYKIKIYATDVDETALKLARRGTYAPDQLGELSEDIRNKYFTPRGDAYTINSSIRDLLIFSRHNLISDPPIPHIDLLLCRNVLIYFDTALQSRVIPNLNYALNDNGYLWLGRAETLVTDIHDLKLLNTKWRMFKKTTSDDYPHVKNSEQLDGYTKSELSTINKRLEQIVQNIKLGFIVLDENFKVVMCNRIVREIWNLLPEQVMGKSFFNLEISYRPANLKDMVEQAVTDGKPLVVQNAEYWVTKEKQIYLKMEILPVSSEAIIFVEDVTEQYESKKELQVTNKALEATSEKLLDANTELASANKELQSINEELQCTNEEIEAANEELKATNEELNARIAELSTMKRYMKWL